MTIATDNLVALTPGGDITEEMIAGYYSFSTIKEEPMPLARVRKAFRDHGLDETRLPEVRRPEHAMQEACAKAQRITQNGTREEVRAEQVMRDEKFLIYQMTRHVHDQKRRVVEHPKALRVIFSFEDGSLKFEPLDGAKLRDVQSIIDDIQTYYDAHRAVLPGRGLRTHLRHYLEAAGAEWMRDGVYFMAKVNPLAEGNKLREHHGTAIDGAWLLTAIADMLTELYGEPANFHIIPCVNDEGQRAFLKRRFIENCTEDLKEFRDECIELVKTKDKRLRGFRQDMRTRIVQQRKELDARRRKFADILGEALDELNRDMTLADKALSTFLTEADA